MNRVTLNLATRPFHNDTIVGSVLLTAAAAVIGATVYNGFVFTNYAGRYELLRQEEQRHRDRLSGLESEERTLAREVQARDFRRLFNRGQFAGDLILKRAFSWTLLFNRLEEVVPPEVMMTAIRPQISGEGIVVRVDGVAKNHDAWIAFQDALQKKPVFARVAPLSIRRLNASRPEINFAMNFDYIPAKSVPGPDAIAAAAREGVPARAAAATPPPAPAAGTVPPQTAAAPGAAPVAGAAPAATSASSATAAATEKVGESGPREVLGTVGRDGRPRTPEVLARVVSAPGGFYPEAPPAPPQEAAGGTKKPKGKSRDAGPAPGAPPPARTTAPGGPARDKASPAKQDAPSGARPAGGSSLVATPAVAAPALWQDGTAAPPARPPLAAARPLPRERGVGPPPLGRQRKAGEPRPIEPIPATRLDMPLKFAGRPVGEVYAALSRAHGVEFEIDPMIDGGALVSADLGGRNFKDAIALVSKAAGHKVVRVEDGRYRVLPMAGGAPLGDRAVQEEALPGAGVTP